MGKIQNIVSLFKGEIVRFPPFSVLLRGTLCPFLQISSEKFWWFPKLFLILPTCRIRGNAEERPPNVSQSQGTTKGIRWSGILTGYSTFFLSLCFHIIVILISDRQFLGYLRSFPHVLLNTLRL